MSSPAKNRPETNGRSEVARVLPPAAPPGLIERIEEEREEAVFPSGQKITVSAYSRLNEPLVGKYEQKRGSRPAIADCGCVLLGISHAREVSCCERIVCPSHVVSGGCAECGESICKPCSRRDRGERVCKACRKKRRVKRFVLSLVGLLFVLDRSDR